MDEDFLLAVQLQEQFDCEASTSSWDHDNDYGQTNKKRKTESSGDIVSYSSPLFKPEQPFSIVDESWETLDPSPDVRAMFLEFNKKFFYGKLSCVEVKWSPRMTLCAGVCSYEGRGGLCSIRLSEPLLKLRPRRDLVQTLLHEMIHALLFVTQNNRDRDGHGPEFCKHMNRINQASGTKITVYHTFHDEVDLYRQHWWRCDGPCQARKPFFGYVKRAMNRAPSDRDPWWAEHRRTCGGTYTKVKEPEDYGKKAKKGEEKDKKTHTRPVGKDKPSSATSGKSGLQDIRNVLPFSGKGFVLGGKSQLSSSQKTSSPSYIRPLTDSPGVSMPLGSPPDQSFAKDISWLSQSSPSKAGSTAVSSSSVELKNLSTRPHPPGKKSVSNTKAFININGSPVRISGTSDRLARPFSNPKVFARAKQKSFSDLLHNGGQQSPLKSGNGPFPAHIANTEREESSADMRNGRPVEGSLNPRAHGQAVGSGSFSNRNSVGIKSSSTDPPQVPSQRFKHPEKSGPASSVSRKRPLEGQNSAQIFDFFQRVTGGSPSARDTRQELASAGRPPAVPTSVASPTVRCPVCQNTVPETRINDHLDSCLV